MGLRVRVALAGSVAGKAVDADTGVAVRPLCEFEPCGREAQYRTEATARFRKNCQPKNGANRNPAYFDVCVYHRPKFAERTKWNTVKIEEA